MTEVEFVYESSVELIDCMASDDSVIEAAKVSTLTDTTVFGMAEAGKFKFINFLMEGRHGSPFEHSVFKWRIYAPIFVWREFMRHRIASYNEQSGRYTQMPAVFYLPPRKRDLVQVGKTGEYSFVPGTAEQYDLLIKGMRNNARRLYFQYEERLERGIAKEVARMDLPLNLMSCAYVTMNARALMNFLSLRVRSEDSSYPSYPMWEIDMVAQAMEIDFANMMPITHQRFVEHGRVQP